MESAVAVLDICFPPVFCFDQASLVIIRLPNLSTRAWLHTPLMISNEIKSPLISGGDGCHEHPTQALYDLFTIYEKKGNFNLNVLFHFQSYKILHFMKVFCIHIGLIKHSLQGIIACFPLFQCYSLSYRKDRLHHLHLIRQHVFHVMFLLLILLVLFLLLLLFYLFHCTNHVVQYNLLYVYVCILVILYNSSLYMVSFL